MAPLFPQESSSDEVSWVGLAPPQLTQNNAAHGSASAIVDESDRPYDAFLYYSDDEVRIKALKLEGPTVAASTNAGTSKRERKTRLSFELDPLLIMEDVMEELMHGGDESSDVDYNKLKHCDDSNRNRLKRCNDSKMDLLAELLNM